MIQVVWLQQAAPSSLRTTSGWLYSRPKLPALCQVAASCQSQVYKAAMTGASVVVLQQQPVQLQAWASWGPATLDTALSTGLYPLCL